MASSYETFKDLELTRDEVERISDALKNKEFRKLLTDYVEDVRNPDNQKIYQEEITQLEKERGVDVTFLNPEAGYVIKTSADGTKKAFINICSNEHVQKPSSNPAERDGAKGLQWSLPHTLTPPREDIDNRGDRCVVFDVVFHSDTLHLAHKNKAFRRMVNDTACNAIETNFDMVLDKKNLKFPKMQYKGFPQAAVIRKPSKEGVPEMSSEEKEFMDKLFSTVEPPKTEAKPKSKKTTKSDDETSKYTTPTYVIKHRRSYEMEEFTNHQHAKINTAIPKELSVEVSLPLLKSSADIVLDVAEKTLQLISEKPAKYKLSLTLPYYVNQDSGNAKFDKDKKKLVITLPVRSVRTLVLSDKDDSGVETDHSSLASPLEEIEHIMEPETDTEPAGNVCKIENLEFLDENYTYSLPEFTAHSNENEHIIVFTLNVKNVDSTTVTKSVGESHFHLKFTSISSGFYPVHYALYVELPSTDPVIDANQTVIDTWDNNVTVQIHYSGDLNLQTFLYGLDQSELTEKCFTVDRIASDAIPVLHPTHTILPAFRKFKTNKKKQKRAIIINGEVIQGPQNEESSPIDISGTSESSSDELCHSLSPGKGRGILKYMRVGRRTVSESGLDEVKWAASLENQFTSVDSVIPEEGEISSSLKKTVRFNDVVSRQLYRSNSSILGQRKKNQRKAKAKKRAQDRRHSESEVSESEERKERESETTNRSSPEEENSHSTESNFNSEIFELDIN